MAQIIQWLAQLWELFRFVYILPQYEGGVVLRFGRFHRAPDTGVVWLWPLIETYLTCPIVPDTFQTSVQSVACSGGRTVSFSLSVVARVSSPARYLLGVNSDSVVLDAAVGSAAMVIRKYGIRASSPLVRQIANRRLRRWGLEVERIQFADLASCVVARLLRD